MDHLQEFQRGIQSIYEECGVLSAVIPRPSSILTRCLHHRTNLVDLFLNGIDPKHFILFFRVLNDNKNTLRSLSMSLDHFGSWAAGDPADNPRAVTELSETAEVVQLWDIICGSRLQLTHLWLVDHKPPERVRDMLISFSGLKELVLEFPHKPETVRSGILNHRASLEKLFWRTTFTLRGDVSHLLTFSDFEDLANCTELRELAVAMIEGDGYIPWARESQRSRAHPANRRSV
ncbi:hypothetical protein AA313_de0206625 [Arthrobotrys entomopaga]|nr:hypothetical protein AA313_de0206625 [Arthrobotrys entomopaga]